MVYSRILSDKEYETGFDRARALLDELVKKENYSEYEIKKDNSRFAYGVSLIVFFDPEHKYEYDRIPVNILDCL